MKGVIIIDFLSRKIVAILLFIIILCFPTIIYGESVSIKGEELLYPIYYNNTEIVFKDSNEKVVHPIIYQDKVYLPIRAVANMLGYNISWNSDRNSIEINEGGEVLINTPELELKQERKNIELKLVKDTRITYNGTLVNLRKEDGLKDFFLSYNGSTYLSAYNCKYLFFIDVELKDKVIITDNKELQSLKTEFFDLLNQNIKTEVKLKTEVEKFETIELFRDYISDIYFYGDDGFFFYRCSLKKSEDGYIIYSRPFEVKERMNKNIGLTDYVFEVAKKIPIKATMTDIEKVKVLNKWIVDNYYYACGNRLFKDLIKSDYAVCGGYALLFEELGEFFGLDVETEGGFITPKGKTVCHAWNKVLINNEWKYVDVCWNDGKNIEKYLLLSEQEMYKYHNS